ncbi:hypothetical protein [Saccharospirillum sp. MSK14-1]|nr:hypothetical protein [Saccharospirillum sp. MSK14-1]
MRQHRCRRRYTERPIVNGADATKFTTYLTQVLADVRRLVL